MAKANETDLVKLVVAVRANPDNNRAWGALASASYEVAQSLRAALVASGRMAPEAQ